MGKGDSGPSDKVLNRQLDIQKLLADLSISNASYGKQLLGPAADYWTSLLRGGQTARVAVGPTAQLVGQSGDATRRSILESMPAGGQRDKALLNSRLGEQGDVARLYSGVQPMAAQNLTTVAGIPYGVSVGFGSASSPNIGASLASMNSNQDRNVNTAAGVGRLLYNATNKGGGGGGGYGTGGQGKGGGSKSGVFS